MATTATQPTRIFAGGAYFKTNTKNFKGGLFRTTPERGEWETMTKGLPENPEARIVRFHPTDPNVVYAGTQDGVYRSLNGGDT